MALPKLPGFGGITDTMLRAIVPLFTDLFNKTVDFLWIPLKPFYTSIWGSFQFSRLMTKQVYGGIVRMSQEVGHFFDNMPQYIAHALISGFTLWFNPLLDLLEDALDEALE